MSPGLPNSGCCATYADISRCSKTLTNSTTPRMWLTTPVGNCSYRSRQQTIDYMDTVLDRSLNEIENKRELTADEFYFYLLALFHEAMHAEALAYTRQTLGYPAPVISDPDDGAPPRLRFRHAAAT